MLSGTDIEIEISKFLFASLLLKTGDGDKWIFYTSPLCHLWKCIYGCGLDGCFGPTILGPEHATPQSDFLNNFDCASLMLSGIAAEMEICRLMHLLSIFEMQFR